MISKIELRFYCCFCELRDNQGDLATKETEEAWENLYVRCLYFFLRKAKSRYVTLLVTILAYNFGVYDVFSLVKM